MNYTHKVNAKQKKPHALKNCTALILVLLALFFFLTPPVSNAQCTGQVTINLESLNAPANLWRIEDILNVEIINNTSEPLETYIVVTIGEVNIGELFIITSSAFMLDPGFSGFINPSELNPIITEDRNPEYSEFMKEVAITTGSLPAGNYEICAYAMEPNTEICYGKSCIFQAIAHPSPPDLIYPANESFVNEDLPIFSWIPPMPSLGQVKYAIEIVEILDGQNPIEAIEANYKWFVKTDLDVTSFQYPVADREFIYGAQYAWRVGAVLGPESNVNPIVMSPVWSFAYRGSEEYVFNENFLVELISPNKDAIVEDLPFFEWELTNPSAQKADKRVSDELVYFDLKIWRWPDTLDGSEAGFLLSELENNPQIEPYYEVSKLRTNYLNITEFAADTLKDNYTYLWKVISIKDEVVIAESEINSFSILSDIDFLAATESMLNKIKVAEESEVYGIIDPLLTGEIIESEDDSDIDSIQVMSDSYLFIIDDEPHSSFGHPVRYVLVDKETKTVEVYNANWFPTLTNADDDWKSSGTTQVKETDIALLKSRGATGKRSRESSSSTASMDEALLSTECKNYALLIDGGDRNRTGAANNIASNAARQADSMQAIYKKKKFNILRFSQYWDYNNKDVAAITVDPIAKKGAKSLADILEQLTKHYASKTCCSSSNLDFELFIYINANAIPNTSKFKIYKPDGSGTHENIDYFEDILKHLQKLPQCVRITLFVDACFSGSLVNPQSLDAYLKRGNFEIITATDDKKTTASGINKGSSAAKDDEIEQLARNIERSASRKSNLKNKETERSFTDEISLAMKRVNTGSDTRQVDFSNFDEILAEAKSSIKKSSEIQDREYPDPQHTKGRQRYERTVVFAALNNQSKIKEFSISPKKAANLVADEKNGNVIIYAKIKGEIKVIATYEDGSRKEKSINSGWADDT